MCVCSSQAEFKLPPALLLLPPGLVLQVTKGTHLSYVKSQDSIAQYVTCFLCQIPGLSCPICDLNCSFPKENIHLLNLPLPLHPLPGAQVPIWSSFLFPSYIMCVSFLQPCLCRSPSLGFQFSVRILPHGDVFAMWLWREVSSTSSY